MSLGSRILKMLEGKMDNLMVCPECQSAAINMYSNGECQCRSCGHKFNGQAISDSEQE